MASAASYSTLVQELYVAYFGRPADYFGLQNFEAALAAANAPTDVAGLLSAYGTNAAVKTLVDSFGTSAESTALYGGGTTASFVDAVFQNLFNRAPAVAGLTFWVDAINSGAVTPGNAALAIAAGAAANTTTQGQTDNTTLANKLAVASNFTTDLGTSSADIVAYSGSAAATTARGLIAGVNSTTVAATYESSVEASITSIVNAHISNVYTLTTGVDTFVGGPGNDEFDATVGGSAPTLNSFDSITGGTQLNTLVIHDFGTGSTMSLPASTTISGITTLNISSVEAIDSDFSGWSTLTNLNVLTATGGVELTAGAAAIAVNEVTGNITINGGTTVSAAIGADGAGVIDVYGGAATTSATLSNAEGGLVVDNNYGTTTANTITSVSITGGSGSYDVNSDALTSIAFNDLSGAALTVNASSAVGGAHAYSLAGDVGDTITDNLVASLSVTTATKASSDLVLHAQAATALTFTDGVDVSFATIDAGLAKAATITGAGAFTADLSGLNAAAVIDATGATGVVTVALSAGESFTGGAGQDIVTVGAAQTGAVVGGNSGINEIVLNNAPGATITSLSAFSNFEVLGVSGSTSGDFAMSSSSNFKSFDVQGSGGAVTFENVTASPTLSLSVENGNVNAITLATTGTVGPTETVTLNVGTTTSGGNTYSNIALEDSSNFGIGTVNLVSNVASSSSANIISKLGDNNLVSLTLSGTGFVHIANVFTDSATSVSISNSLAASSSVSAHLGGFSDAALTSLTFGGSAGIELGTLVTSATSLTLVDNAAGAVIIDSLTDSNLTSATFTNTINSKAGTFTIDGVNTEAALATLTLNGNVGVSVSGDAVTSGITVAGSTDNADVSFVSVGATASGKTDSITLGNGSDTITLGAGVAGSTQTVTLGNGAADSIVSTSLGTVNATVGGVSTSSDSITADSAATVHITAGDGTNAISATSATSATVTVGSGANSITLGAGATGNITLGTHAATVVDSITVGASGTSLTAIDKISGLSNAGLDTITFAADTAASVAAGGMQKITAADLTGITGSDPTSLASWIEAATGAAGSGVTLTAHGINWFTFQTNTYLVETSTGTEGGTLAATDTVVELTGTGYTFAKGTATAGVLHLLG